MIAILRSVLIVTCCAILPSSASAESPMDWYVELKREAKYARIAAQLGRRSELPAFKRAAANLAERIEGWSPAPAKAAARATCREAALSLERAADESWADVAHRAIVDGEPLRDRCLVDIRGR